MGKKKFVTYLLWLFGGILGLHHIYLGRDKHAFIWYTTFGGFLIGYLYDLTKISEYLDYANKNEEYVSILFKLINRLKSPCFYSTYRIFGSIFVSSFYGYILQYTLPIEFSELYPWLFNTFYYIAPLGCAIGTYLVNSESYMKCNFIWSIIGSYGGIVPYLYQHPKGIIFCSIASTLITQWKLEWNSKEIFNNKENKKNEKKTSFKKRLFIFILCASLYTCAATSFFIHNAKVTIDGKTTTVKDAILNFFNSETYENVRLFFVRIWYIYKMYGFQRLKDQFFSGTDSYGLNRAYEVLNINENTSQKELDARCRELSRKWHPDRFKNDEEKQEAQTKFMDIQEACNRVSSYRRSKLEKNKNPNNENEESNNDENSNDTNK